MNLRIQYQRTRLLSMILVCSLVTTGCTNQSQPEPVTQGADIVTQSAEDAILPAMERYSYFVLFPFTLDRNQPSPDGKRFRVKDESLDTFDEVRQFLEQTFSEEITNELLQNGMYEDYDGYLYATGEGRMKDDSIKQVIYQTMDISDTKITYEVRIEYWEQESEIRYFIREQQQGKWVFTSFPYFW